MASIAHDPNGRKRICFFFAGKHQSIRLGVCSNREAVKVKIGIDEIIEARALERPLDESTQQWVDALPLALAAKLAKAGLIPEPAPSPTRPAAAPKGKRGPLTLGAHLADYFDRRKASRKEATVIVWSQARRNLLEFFALPKFGGAGANKPLASVTRADAKDFERWLREPGTRKNKWGENEKDAGLSINTARKRVGNAKQFFEDAVERELIPRNPFAGLKGTVGANRKRHYFVTREEAAKVLEACPDDEWRLLFALSRFGGLRCPSESLRLKWGDVDWQRGRMLVHSPKTEHHEGRESRLVPIFPELLPYLEAVYDAAPEGTEHVIQTWRSAKKNFRTRMARILKTAGLKPWPNLIHSLRKSRQTELEDVFPTHVVCAWLGNNERTAAKHYLLVTEAHFDRATAPDAAQSGAISGAIDLKGVATACQQEPPDAKNPAISSPGNRRQILSSCTVAEAGLEPARG